MRLLAPRTHRALAGEVVVVEVVKEKMGAGVALVALATMEDWVGVQVALVGNATLLNTDQSQ